MKNSKEIIAEIKRIRKQKKMSVEKLANKVGIAKSTLSRYESGDRNFPINDIGKYAQALETSVSELLGIEDIYESKKEVVKVPRLGHIACGDPILAEENIEGYVNLPADQVPAGKVFTLTAKGDSMEPTIPEGSIVLFRFQEEVENGEIAAVLVNGDTEATLKRVRKQDENILLLPDNNNYAPIVVNETYPARIIGKAIQYTQNL
ncbi:LexA family protein [Halobacillus salinus]|uniref:XRE family transcriptional regulator n=1 Tax=Halobacillus salinus TaxID=192814 RepID=A0A4Z0H6J4_9BACI|nr:XRE family transcriptional regulator [Halobacillus salinus]TGB04715.1 XRE family transcriptional regulator [Halobacillus salinus]